MKNMKKIMKNNESITVNDRELRLSVQTELIVWEEFSAVSGDPSLAF